MVKEVIVVFESTRKIYPADSSFQLRHSYKTIILSDELKAQQKISQYHVSIVIIDLKHPRKKILENYLQKHYPLTPVIYIDFIFGVPHYYSADPSSNNLITDTSLDGLLFEINQGNKRNIVNEESKIHVLLTPQEERILQLLEKGCTNKEIAQILGLMETTVKTYNYILFQKLSVKNRTEAIMVAKREEII